MTHDNHAWDDQLAELLVELDNRLRAGAAGRSTEAWGDGESTMEGDSSIARLEDCLRRLAKRWPESEESSERAAITEHLVQLDERLRGLGSESAVTHAFEPAGGDGHEDAWPDLKGCLERLANRWPRAAEDATPSLPDRIGRFEVKGILGEGSFGRVFLAYDEQLQRQVAIKIPHSRLLLSPQHGELYLSEARSVAGLDHPQIVPVYDVGQTQQFPCYIVSK